MSVETLSEVRKRIARRRARLAGAKNAPGAQRRGLALRTAARQIGAPADDPEFMRTVRELARTSKAASTQVQQMKSQMDFMRRQLKKRSAPLRPTVDLPGVEDGEYVREKGSNVRVKHKFMFTRAIKFLLTGREDGCEFEAEVIRQTEKRSASLTTKTALEAGTDTLGGFLIPNQIINEMIELIRAQAVVLQAGATVMPGLTGSPVQIPKMTGASTGYWVGENVAPTVSNQTFGQITMSPHTAAAYTQISKRLIMLSNPGAEAVVREDLSLQLALLIDLAMLRGGATAGEPIGIANTSGIGSYAMGTNGGPLTYDDLVKIVQVVRAANGIRNAKSLAWIIPTALIPVIQLMRDSQNRPLLLSINEGAFNQEPGEAGQGGPVGRLLGYPVYDTTQIPTNLTKAAGTSLTEVYFGDIGSLLVGQWGGVTIEASGETSTAFLARQIWIMISQDLDVAVRQPDRLVYCSDVQSS